VAEAAVYLELSALMEHQRGFAGKMPPSLLKVLAGELVAPNTGFHKIAMQAAITANALGWTEEQLLAACEGVVEKHQSDGHRYNTPALSINATTRAFFGLLGERVYGSTRLGRFRAPAQIPGIPLHQGGALHSRPWKRTTGGGSNGGPSLLGKCRIQVALPLEA
jgi:hypothetical protein